MINCWITTIPLASFDIGRILSSNRLFVVTDVEKYIKPLNRNNSQYGWYVYIEKCKADFGGVHISLDESKKNAIEFINNLKNHLAKHLDDGKLLKPSLPLTIGNFSEELG